VEKCVIFGIDGADFYLTRQLMDEGDLPNLKCLSQKGSYNSLLSTIPPLTPQAWSSFACGVNPGKHGIFDFGEVPLQTYEPVLNTSIDRQTRGFWDYENFKDNKNIFFIPNNNLDSWIYKINLILNLSNEEYDNFSNNCESVVKKQHSMDIINTKLEYFINNL